MTPDFSASAETEILRSVHHAVFTDKGAPMFRGAFSLPFMRYLYRGKRACDRFEQAERDLRMVRMKSKVIGTFRSEQGANDFLILKSITSTAAKAKSTAFDALLSLFHGHLLLGD